MQDKACSFSLKKKCKECEWHDFSGLLYFSSKSCGVQIIISPFLTEIPSSTLKLPEVRTIPLIKLCFICVR